MAIAVENHKKSYMKRFRVKYKRRRQCKTNYKKRIRLVSQYKNKYGAQKFRFVVRKTNRDIICQVFSSDLTHDKCLVSAYSHELRRYGIQCGFTSYPAAYCTGLLLARRLYKKLNKANEANEEVNGDFYLDEESGAFKAFMDTGIARASTGANIFGALKGAVDGGLHIPHNTRRFPGSTFEPNDEGKKQWEYNPESHRDRIFGVHISDYMRKLKSDDSKAYEKQFSQYIKANIGPDDIEKMYKTAHEKIRADPNIARCELEKGYFKGERKTARKSAEEYAATRKGSKQKKLTGKEKKLKVLAKLERAK